MKRNVSAKQKEYIFWRDEAVCRICKEGVRDFAWDIDHILPLCDGGSNEDSNLQLLCCNCHAVKTRTENIERREKKKEVVVQHICENPYNLEQYRYVP